VGGNSVSIFLLAGQVARRGVREAGLADPKGATHSVGEVTF